GGRARPAAGSVPGAASRSVAAPRTARGPAPPPPSPRLRRGAPPDRVRRRRPPRPHASRPGTASGRHGARESGRGGVATRAACYRPDAGPCGPIRAGHRPRGGTAVIEGSTQTLGAGPLLLIAAAAIALI